MTRSGQHNINEGAADAAEFSREEILRRMKRLAEFDVGKWCRWIVRGGPIFPDRSTLPMPTSGSRPACFYRSRGARCGFMRELT